MKKILSIFLFSITVIAMFSSCKCNCAYWWLDKYNKEKCMQLESYLCSIQGYGQVKFISEENHETTSNLWGYNNFFQDHESGVAVAIVTYEGYITENKIYYNIVDSIILEETNKELIFSNKVAISFNEDEPANSETVYTNINGVTKHCSYVHSDKLDVDFSQFVDDIPSTLTLYDSEGYALVKVERGKGLVEWLDNDNIAWYLKK